MAAIFEMAVVQMRGMENNVPRSAEKKQETDAAQNPFHSFSKFYNDQAVKGIFRKSFPGVASFRQDSTFLTSFFLWLGCITAARYETV